MGPIPEEDLPELVKLIDSLATIWANSEQGMYTEEELVEALAPHMSVLQDSFNVEFAFTLETKENGTSIVRMFNTGSEGTVNIPIYRGTGKHTVSTVHTHARTANDGNSFTDVTGFAFDKIGDEYAFTGNSYVVRGNEITRDSFASMRTGDHEVFASMTWDDYFNNPDLASKYFTVSGKWNSRTIDWRKSF